MVLFVVEPFPGHLWGHRKLIDFESSDLIDYGFCLQAWGIVARLSVTGPTRNENLRWPRRRIMIQPLVVDRIRFGMGGFGSRYQVSRSCFSDTCFLAPHGSYRMLHNLFGLFFFVVSCVFYFGIGARAELNFSTSEAFCGGHTACDLGTGFCVSCTGGRLGRS